LKSQIEQKKQELANKMISTKQKKQKEIDESYLDLMGFDDSTITGKISKASNEII